MYMPSTGRFDALDPYAGGARNPQSLHKYSYVHGDPVNHTDPSGQFIAASLGVLGGLAGAYYIRQTDIAKVGVLASVIRGTAAGVSGLAAYFATIGTYFLLNASPKWSIAGSRPTLDENATINTWEQNVATYLKGHVNSRTDLTATQRQSALSVVDEIAHAYVMLAQQRGKDFHGLKEADGVMFGRGGYYGWGGNWRSLQWFNFETEEKCPSWTTAVRQRMGNLNLKQHGWVVRAHYNANKAGDYSQFLLHSFVSLTLDPNATPSGTQRDPDIILDPWSTGRPDVYDGKEFSSAWPYYTASVDGL